MRAYSLLALVLLPSLALAQQEPDAPQPPPSPASPEPLPVAPVPPPPTPAQDDITISDWKDANWTLLPPRTVMFDLDGYFRVRGDTLRKLNFNNGTTTEGTNRYIANDGKAGDRKASYTGTNMRLRLEPHIRITDQIEVVTTLDLLDNLVLGSTPNVSFTPSATQTPTPTHVLSRTQVPMQRGKNALSDSILVRRAYARVTALNEQLSLTVGRMPDHFGLGMLANSGDCLDCDYGTVVDRIAITFKAADHLFTPMFDWVSNGPVWLPFGSGQALDALTWDDAIEYGIRVVRADSPRAIDDALAAGHSVINYGVWGGFRKQARDLPYAAYVTNQQADTEPGKSIDTAKTPEVRRNAFLFTGDAYVRFFISGLELSLETVTELGSFRDETVNGAGAKTTMKRLGAAFEGKYHFNRDRKGVMLSLRSGMATGDTAPGFGALNQADTQRFGNNNGTDLKLDNFQFNPDYRLDLLMFRHIIGTVTDAWYLRPEIAYTFQNDVTGSFAAIYSQSMFSGAAPSNGLKNRAKSMGLELDAEIFYGQKVNPEAGAINGSLAAGFLFPMGAFKNPARAAADQGGGFAWTVQGRMYITF